MFITGRRGTELDAAVEVIGSAATAASGDISNLADLDRLYETIRSRQRGLDVLFANASVSALVPLEQVTEEHFDILFGINDRGMLFTAQKALPLLNDGASVILNGSTNVDVGDEALGVYAAAKAATRSFFRTWANELKGRGIRVNTITPGPTETPALSGLPPPRSSSSSSWRRVCRWAGSGARRRSPPPWPSSLPSKAASSPVRACTSTAA